MEETHHGEHYKSTHPAAVLIAGNAIDTVAEHHVYESANMFLCLPWLPDIVVDVWNMKAGFIAHRELADHAGGIRQYVVELILWKVYHNVEKIVKFLFRFRSPAHKFEEAFKVVLDIPLECVGVVLCVVGSVHVSWVHILYPM